MTNNRKSSVNSRLRDARRERGWSQQQLADKVGTTSINISRWENGSTFPNPSSRQRLCDVFGKTLTELGLLPPAPPGSRAEDIPIARNPYFTGREPLLAMLHRRLAIARSAALTQPQALFGLGGIGKTQTAAEYAFRYGNEYAYVFWIRAATRETLIADFVTLARLLDLPEKEEQDQLRVVAVVKRWLAANEGWLLILDNADDLPLARQFLPTNHKGYILFTTRAQASGAIAASIEVEKLTQQEGTLLLLHWSKLLDREASLDEARATDRAEASRIAQEMDGLPLALVQAGAYVEETGCSLADYLRLFETHRKAMLERHSRFMVDYDKTVATTWEISFQKIKEENPAAAELLSLCSFLAPDAIPEALLKRGAAEFDTVQGAEARDLLKFNDALEILRRFSLLRRDGNTHLLSVHRLVQMVLRESMDHETQSKWAERALRAVNAAFPEVDYSTGEKQRYYLPHVQECARLIKEYDLNFSEAAGLLHQAGEFLYFHGLYDESHSLHRQALAIREQVFGPDEPAVAESLNALAVLARLLGDFEEAERFHRQALAIREHALGPHDLTTALSLNNLGVLYRNLGRYEQAEPLLQRAFSIYEQARGSDDPATLMASINLGKLYIDQDSYEQAETLLQQALATAERALTAGPTLIAQILSLLARLSYEQGSYERAETLWQRSLAIFEQTFGPEHPATAGLLNELAEVYSAQGRYSEALSRCRRALSICEKKLGPEHPDTIEYRKHLGMILSRAKEKQDDKYHPAPSAR